MSKRFKKRGPLDRTYLKQWREFRKKSQDDLADEIGTSGATVSRMENGETPYSQDYVEAVAEALGCTVADLISRDPRIEGSFLEEAMTLLRRAQTSR